MDKPENPRAFPNNDSETYEAPQMSTPGHPTHYTVSNQKGMTLRDYFATHSPLPFEVYLKGLSKEQMEKGMTYVFEQYAAARFQYADAMLKARQS